MKEVLLLIEKIKKGEVNIQNLSKETGISAPKIYKWKDRNSEISLSDALKLQEWIDKQGSNLYNSRNPQQIVPGETVEDKLDQIQASLTDLQKQQILTRADVRAFGEYHVMKDAKGDDQVRLEIMEQINRLVSLHLGANAGEGTLVGILGKD